MRLWFTKTISPKKAYCCMAQTEQKKEEERGGGEGNLYKVCELGISVDYQSMHLQSIHSHM
jgi:hypothetical protein